MRVPTETQLSWHRRKKALEGQRSYGIHSVFLSQDHLEVTKSNLKKRALKNFSVPTTITCCAKMHVAATPAQAWSFQRPSLPIKALLPDRKNSAHHFRTHSMVRPTVPLNFGQEENPNRTLPQAHNPVRLSLKPHGSAKGELRDPSCSAEMSHCLSGLIRHAPKPYQ
jgi:hypothetical protein